MDYQRTAIATVQEFWDRRPCNIRHSPRPVGSREYFDEVERRKYFVEPHIPAFADFPRWYGKKVLEIGCGIGTDTINFARHGAEVAAVDLSERSLEIARRRAEIFGFADRICFYHGNAEELSAVVPPGPFDLIYSFGVIHHTPHPDRVLEQLRSYCHPDTVLKVMVYHRYSWRVLSLLLTEAKGRFWNLAGVIARHSEAQSGCPVTYTYSRREASDILQRHGFRVQELFVDHIFPYRITDYVEYRYRKEWYFRMLPAVVFRWLERRLGWHLCMTAQPAANSPR
jgi:2-polyprenyl-3-methyl-5-hydroxy-6-metoxy-1,4-benzoquinol methylase